MDKSSGAALYVGLALGPLVLILEDHEISPCRRVWRGPLACTDGPPGTPTVTTHVGAAGDPSSAWSGRGRARRVEKLARNRRERPGFCGSWGPLAWTGAGWAGGMARPAVEQPSLVCPE